MRAFFTLSPKAAKSLDAFLDREQTIGFYSKKENRIDNAVVPQEVDFFKLVGLAKETHPDDNAKHLPGVFTIDIAESTIGMKEFVQWWNPSAEAKHHTPKKVLGYMTGKGTETDGGNWLVFYPETRRVAYGGRRHGLVKILAAADINNLFNNNFEAYQYSIDGTNTPFLKPWQVLNKENQGKVLLTIQKKELSSFPLSTEQLERFADYTPEFRKKIITGLKGINMGVLDATSDKPGTLKDVVESIQKYAKAEPFRRSRMEGFITKLLPVETNTLKLFFGVRFDGFTLKSMFGGLENIFLPKKTKPGRERVVPNDVAQKAAKTPEPKKEMVQMENENIGTKTPEQDSSELQQEVVKTENTVTTVVKEHDYDYGDCTTVQLINTTEDHSNDFSGADRIGSLNVQLVGGMNLSGFASKKSNGHVVMEAMATSNSVVATAIQLKELKKALKGLDFSAINTPFGDALRTVQNDPSI